MYLLASLLPLLTLLPPTTAQTNQCGPPTWCRLLKNRQRSRHHKHDPQPADASPVFGLLPGHLDRRGRLGRGPERNETWSEASEGTQPVHVVDGNAEWHTHWRHGGCMRG
ncbi:hypothetical protein BU23DRAFT_234204 [Bimuria novae-zelandiae CBS 107.79]|uniref:Secreted protein n=1 Tax=Bimuria novae-zelandiae CBS 107.79 TaxID=1447943 RepID=A0A6A5V922_9PLEO|nr:hypothetical protein BU23DRAFT_234204 [Bimuria novae-zelandiae CBS 107.79]